MTLRRKTRKEQMKDAIWNLTCAEGNIRRMDGCGEIGKEILKLRDKLKEISH